MEYNKDTFPFNAAPGHLQRVKDGLIARHHQLIDMDSWIPKRDSEGIRSWIHHPADGTISMLKAESVIGCDAEALFDYLVRNLPSTCKEWNDVMYFAEVIAQPEAGAEVARVISEGNWVADREDVFLRFYGYLENGHLFEVSAGLDEGIVPVKRSFTKYIVRSRLIFCSKEIVPLSASSCRYLTIWHYDPVGYLSRLIPRKWLGGMILKNLEHEHEKLGKIFGR